MARRPSKHLRPPRPLPDGLAQRVSTHDGDWVAAAVSAQRAVKAYRCPGCQREVGVGEPHVVAWPATPPIGSSSPVEARRHWHTPCWNRRRA